MSARWLVVLLTAAAFVATPLLISARQAAPSDISAAELAGRIAQSAPVGWSGYVETARGEHLVFSILANNYADPVTSEDIEKAMDDAMVRLVGFKRD